MVYLRVWTEINGRRVGAPSALYIPNVPDFDPPDECDDEDVNAAPPAWQVQSITGRTFVINYSDAHGRPSERQVQGRRLERQRDGLYLHAYCFVRERLRIFRADRILAVIDTETGEVHQPGEVYLQQFLPDHITTAGFRYGLSVNQFADFNAALNVLTFIAKCDGERHPLEDEKIEDFAMAFWLWCELKSELDLHEVKRHIARLAPDAEAFWVSINRCREHPVLSKLIRRHVSAVIDADGRHHPKELYWGSKIDEIFAQ